MARMLKRVDHVLTCFTASWFGTSICFSIQLGIIPTDFHSIIFQRGRAKNHQPVELSFSHFRRKTPHETIDSPTGSWKPCTVSVSLLKVTCTLELVQALARWWPSCQLGIGLLVVPQVVKNEEKWWLNKQTWLFSGIYVWFMLAKLV